MTRQYVHRIDPADRVGLRDADIDPGESDLLDRLADRQFLDLVLPRLAPREELVVRLRFGLGGVGVHSAREIASEYGIASAAVYRIEAKALRKMRWYACRVFPDRARRAGMEAKTGALPQTRIEDRQKRVPRVPGKVPPAVQARPPVSACPPSRPRIPSRRPTPTLRSGWLLTAVVGLYIAMLGFNSAIAYHLADRLGASVAIMIAIGVGMLGVITALIPTVYLDFAPHDPTPAQRRVGLKLVMATLLAGASGFSTPVQPFLQALVLAAPPRFHNSTPETVQVFSFAIVPLSLVYLCGWLQRERKLEASSE
ncbi:MAG: hypothetical protein KDE55_14300 [Novosphingobium sp.]|nr:hypothetical protein [Novosphingobium sp.]